jgi:hypothetical protein
MAADWWLRYFQLDVQVTALRLEYLSEDLNRQLLPLLPAGTPTMDPLRLPRVNASPAQTNAPQFESADLERIHRVNPLWSSWQHKLYASTPGTC